MIRRSPPVEHGVWQALAVAANGGPHQTTNRRCDRSIGNRAAVQFRRH
jgi:hypothetical protein